MATSIKREIELTPIYFDYLLENDYDVVIEVGGRFSGKSHNEQIRLDMNLENKKDYKLLVIEDLETGMADGFHAGLRDRIEEFGHEDYFNPRSRTAYIKNMINGNEALFRGYATDQQRLNVKKLSGITEILVEEGEWMDYDSFISLLQQLRGGRPEDRKMTILMNPVNPYCFVNQLLIEGAPDKVLEYFDYYDDEFPNGKRPKVFEKHLKVEWEENGKKKSKAIVVLVVLTIHSDNPFLTDMQRATIEGYKVTDPDKYKQLGLAKFIRSGLTHFKEFKDGIHVIKPFKIPSHWKRYNAIDYGLDMLSGLWIAIDEAGRGYLYKEVNEPDLIISKASYRLHQVNYTDTLHTRYGPGDLWNRRQETGKSAYDIFNANGWHMSKADRDREDGTLAMKEWLAPYENINEQTGDKYWTANLLVFNTCTTFIDHIKQVLTDEKNPNCYATEPHEFTHVLDAFRYFAIMRQTSTEPIKAMPMETWLPDAMKEPSKEIKRILAGDIQEDDGGFTW